MESPLRPGAPGAWPDLPFFWLDFRRLLRKGALWRVLLITVALPAGAFALTAGVLTLLGGPEGRPGWPPGPILFSVVAVFHGLGMLSLVTRLLTLHGEAAADRLDQLRLLPYTRQQLMLNLAGGRALLRLFTLAAPLPVYLLLMAYGSVALSDLVGLYFLLGLGLYGIPGRLEVTTALTSRTLQQGQSREQGNPAVSMVAILLASSFQLLAPVLGRVMLQFFRGLEEAVRTVAGPDYLASLPGSLVGLCGQLVVTPLPFFGLPVHPLIPILAYSALRTVARLVDSSELWSREVQAGNGMVGVNSAVLLPETGRTDEQQRLAWLHAAQAVLLAVLLLGYLWNSTITTGTLGKLSGSATAGGALAACLVLWCGLHLSLRCEALRSLVLITSQPPRARDLLAALLDTTGLPVLTALVAALLGGIPLVPELASAMARLLVLAVGALCLLRGSAVLHQAWQVRFSVPDPDLPGGRRYRPAAHLWFLPVWLWYGGPLLLLRFHLDWTWFHAAVSWSPVYGLLRLLQGLWNRESPLPLDVVVFLPLLLGALLHLTRRPAVPSDASTAPEPPRVDPVERRLSALADRWDNPIFLLQMARQKRRASGMAGSLIWAALVYGGGPLALLGLILTLVVSSGTTTVGQFLAERPLWGLNPMGLVGVFAAVGSVPVHWFHWVIGMGVLQSERQQDRLKQRDHGLLLSAVSEPNWALGKAAAAMLRLSPSLVVLLGFGAAYALLAVLNGAPLWFPVLWFLLTAGALLLGLHQILGGLSYCKPSAAGLVFSIVAIQVIVAGGALVAVLPRGRAAILAYWPWICAVGLLLPLSLLPRRWKRTLAAIARFRLEGE